jgi:hypothetical protein
MAYGHTSNSGPDRLNEEIARRLRALNETLCKMANETSAAPEVDTLITNWLPICVAGIQHYVAEKFQHNNSTNVTTFIEKVYKLGAEGIPTAVVPVGTLTQDYCGKAFCDTCRS